MSDTTITIASGMSREEKYDLAVHMLTILADVPAAVTFFTTLRDDNAPS